MGEAFVGVADDTNTVLYNPAGFAQLNQFELTGMYSDLYSNLNARLYTGQYGRLGYNFVSIASPLEWSGGSLGASWTQLYSVFYKENTLTLSYGRRISKLNLAGGQLILDVGANLKGLQWMVEANDFTDNPFYYPFSERQKTGLTADLGVLAHLPGGLTVGADVDNVVPVDMGLAGTEIIPPVFRFGLAYRLGIHAYGMDEMLMAMEWDTRNDGSNDIYDVKFGLENMFLKNQLALRLGLTSWRVTAGFGVRLHWAETPWEAQVDYAFAYPFYIMETWGTHRIGLTIRWDLEAHERMRESIKQEEKKAAEVWAKAEIEREKEKLKEQFEKYTQRPEPEPENKQEPLPVPPAPGRPGTAELPAPRIIYNQEDKIVVAIEKNVFTDILYIQDAEDIKNRFLNYFNKAGAVVLEFHNLNSIDEVEKALGNGEADVVIEDECGYAYLKRQGLVDPVLAVQKAGKTSGIVCLAGLKGIAAQKLQRGEPLRIGHVKKWDVNKLRQEFSGILKNVDITLAEHDTTRACLVALRLREIDALVAMKPSLDYLMVRDQIDNVQILALVKESRLFAPLCMRSTVSPEKARKIRELSNQGLEMHNHSEGKVLLRILDIDQLKSIEK